MAQNFVYGSNVTIDTIYRVGLKGVPSMRLRDSLFGAVFKLDNLVGKSASVADVLCVQPFKTGYFLDDGFQTLKCDIYPRQWVDISGVMVYAIDSMLSVRHWAKKSFWGVRDSDDFGYNFAMQVAGKYGKVAIVDTQSTECENGLFSVFFPKLDGSVVSEGISKETDERVFRRELTDSINRIKQRIN